MKQKMGPISDSLGTIRDIGADSHDTARLRDFEPPIDPRHLSLSSGQRRRNDKLVHLLSCTAKVLVRDGHAKLSMRSVATEAGVSLSSLQHYFESRDALLLETMRTIMSGYLERYDELRRQRILSATETLDKIIEDMVIEAAKPEVCGFYFEVWALARHEQRAGDLLAQLYQRYRALLIELIREINPGLPDPEIDAIATMISAQSEGLLVMSCHGGALRQPPATLLAMEKRIWPLISRQGLHGMAGEAPLQSASARTTAPRVARS